MSNLILFDEEQNIVEIQYEGVNAQLLTELDVRLTNLENQTASDYFLLNAELDALQATVNALTIMVQQNYDDIQQEIDDRENADHDLSESFANEIILTQQMAANAIQEEAETRAAAIIAEAEARGTAISTLETELNTDISAIATTVTGLASSVAGNTAAIILANEAIALETSTRAAQYSAILADFGDTNAAVLEESVARADADEAFASQLEIIEADFDGVYAAVSDEAIARASADSAMASDITALGVSVGANTTAISSEASARIAADGSIESKYGVKIDVNGNVSGFGLISQANNGTVVSTFNFRSDVFKIFNGSTTVAPFSVSGGVVYMANVVIQNAVIENAAITTAKIANNAVTNSAATQAGFTLSLVNNTWTELVAQSITSTGGRLVSLFRGELMCEGGPLSSSTQIMEFRILRDGVVIRAGEYRQTTGTSDQRLWTTDFLIEDLPAGTYIYSVEGRVNDSQPSSTQRFGGIRGLFVLEIKK